MIELRDHKKKHGMARTENCEDYGVHLCKMDIFLEKMSISQSRKNIEEVLKNIDSCWKFIQIRDICTFVETEQNSIQREEDDDHQTSVQALCVVLFFHEDKYSESLEAFRGTPNTWQLRYVNKLHSNVCNNELIGCLEYYELLPKIPLFALARVHYGRKILRFNIFVEDFDGMKTFYEKLTARESTLVRSGFCVFKIRSYTSLEIQLTLTREIETSLYHMSSTALRLKFHKIDVSQMNFLSHVDQVKPLIWKTTDPEGNLVLLEQVLDKKQRKLEIENHQKSCSSDNELVFV